MPASPSRGACAWAAATLLLAALVLLHAQALSPDAESYDAPGSFTEVEAESYSSDAFLESASKNRHGRSYYKKGPKNSDPLTYGLPKPVLSVPLNYNHESSRYMMTLQLGTNNQELSAVFDTGSGSLYSYGYNPAMSTTSQATNGHPIFGYGSGARIGSTFFQASFAIPGTEWGSRSRNSLALRVPMFDWIAAFPFQPAYNPTLSGTQGLVGWSPAGWNMTGTGSLSKPDDIAGAVCPSTSDPRKLVPCNNVPTVFEALVDSGVLSPKHNMFSVYLHQNTSVNGGLKVGTLLLGGADSSLAAGPYVTTPLQPNRWRTDFITGDDVFVFWQFNPRRISVVANDGSRTDLCKEGDIKSKNACTAIADTGYGTMVVTQDAPRMQFQNLLNVDSNLCGVELHVELPTNLAGTSFTTLRIPLTSDTSNDCKKLLLSPNDIGPAPAKFVTAGVLPPNWFVFGQPILQQLYSVFDFTAYKGNGGLHFAPAAKAKHPAAESSIVVPVAPGMQTGMPVRIMQFGFGQYSSPVTLTVDSGSGILDFNCLPDPSEYAGCPQPYVTGQLYQESPTALAPPCPNNTFEGGCSYDGKCQWNYLYFPSGDQPIGDVYQDSIQIFGLPSTGYQLPSPTISFKGSFGCVSRYNHLYDLTRDPDPYNKLINYTNTCPTPVYGPSNTGLEGTCPQLVQLAPGGFNTVIGLEAGHDRALSSVPQQLFQNGVISKPVWGMCVAPLSKNDIASCPDPNQENKPSYVVYGDGVPRGSNPKSTLMLTPVEIDTAVRVLGMSTLTQQRLQTRYLVATTALNLTLQDGTTVSNTYDTSTGLTNMDTGAVGALQIPKDQIFQAYYDSIKEAVQRAGPAVINCVDAGIDPSSICGANINGSYGCYYKNATSSDSKDLDKAAQDLLTLYPKSLRWTFAGGASTDVTVAFTVPGCNVKGAADKMVFVCSHISAQGTNFGIEYPFWVAQSWMYNRYIQYDMRTSDSAPAGVFRFTDTGGADCSQFADVVRVSRRL